MVGHEAGARTEDGEVGAAFLHQLELVLFDGLAQVVVADLQFAELGCQRRVLEAGDLAVAPFFQRFRCRRVVAVDVDDHAVFLFVRCRPSCAGCPAPQ
ncbi:hypothetical protein SDC9_152937 [bioreactor metagenome]|uniref:Uncharacterized protein n=1 Tax=bioreactor metagenome TaxID=1076179 RepID=A0A645EW82_9ZZZZ